MLKSLYAGVSGLQSHQIAMDVESNNIANVNTVGFKYSRANFSDLLAQTRSIATAPQGELGGKNAVQVGLGSTVSSMTTIHSQGSIQNSDKNTDVAIQGDGFFIVSPDGGNSYKYTRAGDFKFDASGNFVDNNGFIVQGWVRDNETGKVDATAPIENINIPPGLTTPASPTTEVALKANLNAGTIIESFSPAYEVSSGSTGATPAIDENGNPIASGDLGVMFNDVGEGFSLQDDQGIWASFTNATYSNILDTIPAGATTLDISFTLDDGSTQAVTYTGLAGATDIQNANGMVSAINAQTGVTGVRAEVLLDGGGLPYISLENNNTSSFASHNINLTVGATDTSGAFGAPAATVTDITAYRYQYDPVGADDGSGGADAPKTFRTINGLRNQLEIQARADGGATSNIEISVNEQGKLEISNEAAAGLPADDYDINLAITGITSSNTPGAPAENQRFTRNMEALNSVLTAGSTAKAFSQSFNAATHSSSIDIFDSLGSKHTLRMEFRKTDVDIATGTTWDMKISVPPPATIGGTPVASEQTGQITFNSDGSLSGFNPPNISFTGNNGSAAEQQVSLNFGTGGLFDGMTSFDSRSSTSGISQDGFTGGDLVGIRIDQSGTVVGSFSNGRSFGLAQVGMAKFTNNEGLTTEGGSVYVQTANSGDPIIGSAATSGRGFIQSSALEASNVDLSRSLTQLIIIQRGYQANGKTITTSDTLLETLIGLKR
ncbi:MAG: flagellar hook protein FlgE [Sulfurimonas sp.]|uniref:flagellar hook protein FlgE n=1 Tax=Sulfurimonas sp. TaxID=2022749 RepID=UPI0026203706|nr:flagellar hook protein FlgE [Sulfurimonas sp.]MCW8894559.1 flagellar hook protein FlgE [Sulfurimonas sp.]MCW8953765.1 flagellar hook protein FlgE [Sulfurimonas sp.]MCW9068481.1 flagellar hook protein FlgE [Sulfurimonas sp.]